MATSERSKTHLLGAITNLCETLSQEANGETNWLPPRSQTFHVKEVFAGKAPVGFVKIGMASAVPRILHCVKTIGNSTS